MVLEELRVSGRQIIPTGNQERIEGLGLIIPAFGFTAEPLAQKFDVPMLKTSSSDGRRWSRTATEPTFRASMSAAIFSTATKIWSSTPSATATASSRRRSSRFPAPKPASALGRYQYYGRCSAQKGTAHAGLKSLNVLMKELFDESV